jgi:ribosomal protein S18 acetylase RimI-like enzyme
MNIRPMLEDDADAVRRVDTLAFTPIMIKTGASRDAGGEFPLRTRENILSGRAIFPQGCFVADAGHELAGYIFGRAWGRVGWVGVFGVHPQYQGQRIGQQLLARTIAALRSAGCTTIGLETNPGNYYNLGLYSHHGFRPITTTLSLQKAVQMGTACTECRILKPEDGGGLKEISRISHAAWPGLDLRAEAVNALQYGWGQPVLVGVEAAHTIAIARVASRRENLPNTLYEVTALAALPEARPRLGEVVQSLEVVAAQQGFSHLRLILNSADWESLQTLLNQGYQVVLSALRFMLAGDYGGHPGLEFSRWAM